MPIQDTQKLSKTEIKIFSLSAIGGALEFYDFIIYVFFAQILAQLFFNTTSVVSNLLLSFSVFATGYIARVFGGLVFSHFGDRYGRKKSFALTLFLMAFPTLCIGLLPTYSQIGIIATILLVICRILQGFAIGGEIPCSLTFVYEHASYKNRAYACSLLFCGLVMGIFLGSLVSAIATKSISTNSLMDWGWRIPFIFGGVLGFVGVYLRKYLNETPEFQKIYAIKALKVPVIQVLKEFLFSTINSITVILSIAVSVTLYLLYLPTYLHIYFNFPSSRLLVINSIAVVILCLFIVLFGKLSKFVGPRKIFNFGLILFIIFAYPVLHQLQSNNYLALYLIYAHAIIATSAVTAAGVFLVADSYPTQVRYSGVSLSYNIAFGVFGGFTPFISTYLIKVTNSRYSPAYYMTGICILALGFSLLPSKKNTRV